MTPSPTPTRDSISAASRCAQFYSVTHPKPKETLTELILCHPERSRIAIFRQFCAVEGPCVFCSATLNQRFLGRKRAFTSSDFASSVISVWLVALRQSFHLLPF